MMTLLTDAMSDLPRNQFAHPALIPLPVYDLEARDAFLRHYLGFAYAAHCRERFPQALEIDSRRYGERETRQPVDRRQWSHTGGGCEPDCGKHRADAEHGAGAEVLGDPPA